MSFNDESTDDPQSDDSVDAPTEKRVKRWAISIEDLIVDPTGKDAIAVDHLSNWEWMNCKYFTRASISIECSLDVGDVDV